MANLISLELVVDKAKNRVVFAESDADFVDVIFSFLMLPMGTVVRLLGKKSGLECFDKLYECVENLDSKYFQTEACRTMLLQPRTADEAQCEDLKIVIHDRNPQWIYSCPIWECYAKTHCLYSYVPGVLCRCGKVMNKILQRGKRNVDSSGVFLKGSSRFMISEELHVTPISTKATLSVLQKLRNEDRRNLDYRTVNVDKQQVLNLLKGAMKSKTPLTDVFLSEFDCDDKNAEVFNPIETPLIKVESGEEANGSERICVNLLESKSKDKVVYAESGEDLVDQLFSFLTFPLGSIVKFLNKQSSLGCMNNLYHSVELMSDPSSNDYFISEDCKNMLLSPKIATHFACSKQLLTIDEDTSTTSSHVGCKSCFDKGEILCPHGLERVTITRINPKLPTPGTEHGGGFVKRSIKFMVTNEMVVAPFSSVSAIKAITELEMQSEDLTEREESCGEAEVRNLLKACLTSCNVLSSVFSGKRQKRGKLA